MPKAAEISERLLSIHAKHLVCRPDSDLVIEGYPRSANTFSADMIDVLTENDPRFHFGHHTHEIDNLRLAEAYDVPRLVLIRTPEDAILSFRIFSGNPVARCLDFYVNLNRNILALEKPFLVADFSEATTDFNRVVEKLNTVLRKPLPYSQDLAADTHEAQEKARARAVKTHGNKAMKMVGVPTPEREKLKEEMRGDVRKVLDGNSEPANLYQAILARGA